METRTPAKLWVDALRSGEYEQARGELHKVDGGYCCLGVACVLYQEHVGGLEIKEEGSYYEYDGKGCSLPDRVMKWVGLEDSLGRYGELCVDRLAWNNDKGSTFAEIADIIESRPPHLFVEPAPAQQAS